MANKLHLEILGKGVKVWNQWRFENLNELPDLRGADLHGADLKLADLAVADLRLANLSLADLSLANLGAGILSGANLSGANLSGANLSGANLSGANLSGAKLSGAKLSGTRLLFANLVDAVLSDADLNDTDLTNADLRRANVSNARLTSTILRSCKMCGTDVTGSTMMMALIGDVDLGDTKGLESVKHSAPSSLGIDTIIKSRGKIPENFLRGAGVPDLWIQYVASFAQQPFEFYSCFISYSVKDEELASRLHNDFQAAGIRCWKWDHDARTGRSLWGEINQAVRVHDKLVLIASESSLKSPAVNREIERALVQEDERLKRKLAGDPTADGHVLFPVRIDDYLFHGWEHERKVDVTKKVIADARGWNKDSAVYERVRERLLRDLKHVKGLI